MIEKVVTIGAYGFDPETFIAALKRARVDHFLDIRARRGMRGSKYAFANAKHLEAMIRAAGIGYWHAKEYAPSEHVRDAQRDADKIANVAKRDRSRLSEAFTSAYVREKLQDFDGAGFVRQHCAGSRIPVLFCVECEPAACHRSLLAHALQMSLKIQVEDLRP